mgnify:CR=1 FL=1
MDAAPYADLPFERAVVVFIVCVVVGAVSIALARRAIAAFGAPVWVEEWGAAFVAAIFMLGFVSIAFPGFESGRRDADAAHAED